MHITDFYIYDNRFDGTIGDNATSWIFIEGGSRPRRDALRRRDVEDLVLQQRRAATSATRTTVSSGSSPAGRSRLNTIIGDSWHPGVRVQQGDSYVGPGVFAEQCVSRRVNTWLCCRPAMFSRRARSTTTSMRTRGCQRQRLVLRSDPAVSSERLPSGNRASGATRIHFVRERRIPSGAAAARVAGARRRRDTSRTCARGISYRCAPTSTEPSDRSEWPGRRRVPARDGRDRSAVARPASRSATRRQSSSASTGAVVLGDEGAASSARFRLQGVATAVYRRHGGVVEVSYAERQGSSP